MVEIFVNVYIKLLVICVEYFLVYAIECLFCVTWKVQCYILGVRYDVLEMKTIHSRTEYLRYDIKTLYFSVICS